MGARGPIPQREEELARPRKRKGGDVVKVTKGRLRPVTIPEPDEDWHPIALRLWRALETSGQADYYQDSDWAYAYSLCEDISWYKRGVKRSGQMLVALYGAMERLLITEGDRRRHRLELEASEGGDEDPVGDVMAEYAQGLRLVK